MTVHATYWLRAVARLLDYPSLEVYDHQPEIIAALRHVPINSSKLYSLIEQITVHLHRPLLEIQSEYVAQFDHNRRTSLHLFEHVHGDSRLRGQAMVDLVHMYLEKNQFILTDELPDHLPVVLEFASLLEEEEARQLVGEFGHILYHVATNLEEEYQVYTTLLESLLEWVKFDIAKVVKVEQSHISLDKDWEEPPVFGACSPKLPTQPQVMHFVPSTSYSQGANK